MFQVHVSVLTKLKHELHNVLSLTLPVYNMYQPTSIAVDWVTENIYTTDRRAKVIDVYSVKANMQRNIISDNLQDPRAIAVDPLSG